MKKSILARIAALVLTVGVGTSSWAGEEVPIHGTLEGRFTMAMDPGPPPIGTIHLVGRGHAAHVGLFTLEFPHHVNFGVIPPTGVGTYTFTAANGDTLFGDTVGFSTPVEPGVLMVVEDVLITGGTGRFDGARGELVIMRLIFQNTGTTFGCLEGAISSPGSARNP